MKTRIDNLTIEEIQRGRKKILENSRDLVEDSQILLKNAKYARSYTLAHLACEELSKIPMLFNTALKIAVGKEVDWKKLDKKLTNHNIKIKSILYIDFVNDPNTENDEDIKRLIKDIDNVSLYNTLKNISLYTTFIESEFVKPSEVIDIKIAEGMVKLAENRLEFFETTEKYLEQENIVNIDTERYEKLEAILNCRPFDETVKTQRLEMGQIMDYILTQPLIHNFNIKS